MAIPINSTHKGDHSKDSGDPQADPGGCRSPVQVKTDPGHGNNHAGGYIHLNIFMLEG